MGDGRWARAASGGTGTWAGAAAESAESAERPERPDKQVALPVRERKGSATGGNRKLSGEGLARVVVSLDARVELLLESGRVVERLLGRRGLPQLLQLRGLGL